MKKSTFLALTLALGAMFTADAQAAVVELADGRTIQGEILAGQTTDDGLAIRVYQTGGVVVVDWDLVLTERAKALRVEYGIDVPEDEQVTVFGHSVTLTNGTQARGVVVNYDAWQAGAAELELKTPTGIKRYPRDRVAGVAGVENMDAEEAYTTEELYTQRITDAPPETAADHFAMGDFCSRIGDHAHAKEHYENAAADADFVATADGKSLRARLRKTDILLRAQGAQDQARAIGRSMQQNKWNQALEELIAMDKEIEDEKIREAIGFERLQNRVVRGRDDYFRKQVQLTVYRVMESLIDRKVRERKALRRDDDAAPGTAMKGTLAGARSWSVRELPNELWDKVGSDLGLEKEEVDRYWGEKALRKVRKASYGTGSFIVVKRATAPGSEKRRRAPPGSRRRGDSGPGGAGQAAKPKTDEEWWESVRASEKANWIEAYFAENSGIFEKIRNDESKICDNCAGKGIIAVASAEGEENHTHCSQCNGSGKFRTVIYR